MPVHKLALSRTYSRCILIELFFFVPQRCTVRFLMHIYQLFFRVSSNFVRTCVPVTSDNVRAVQRYVYCVWSRVLSSELMARKTSLCFSTNTRVFDLYSHLKCSRLCLFFSVRTTAFQNVYCFHSHKCYTCRNKNLKSTNK